MGTITVELHLKLTQGLHLKVTRNSSPDSGMPTTGKYKNSNEKNQRWLRQQLLLNANSAA
jgi:hypothetical protein